MPISPCYCIVTPPRSLISDSFIDDDGRLSLLLRCIPMDEFVANAMYSHLQTMVVSNCTFASLKLLICLSTLLRAGSPPVSSQTKGSNVVSEMFHYFISDRNESQL